MANPMMSSPQLYMQYKYGFSNGGSQQHMDLGCRDLRISYTCHNIQRNCRLVVTGRQHPSFVSDVRVHSQNCKIFGTDADDLLNKETRCSNVYSVIGYPSEDIVSLNLAAPGTSLVTAPDSSVGIDCFKFYSTNQRVFFECRLKSKLRYGGRYVAKPLLQNHGMHQGKTWGFCCYAHQESN